MRYVEAVDYGWLTSSSAWKKQKSLFLGGGITSCPQWQDVMVEKLEKTNLTLLNPRRADFPMDDPDAAEQQIVWEFDHLRAADGILFWFPKETLCPITLFELGKWVTQEKPLFIGCHPEYARKQDVEIQTRLVGRGLQVATSLDQLADWVFAWEEHRHIYGD